MAVIKLNSSTPAPPAKSRNITWQADSQSPQNISGYIKDMTGDSGSGGSDGLVPPPGAGDAAAGKFLKADGTWAIPPYPAPAVTSVAGKTGSVTLTESDIANLTSDLAAKANASSLATVATSGSYNDLSSKPGIPAASASTPSMDGAAAAGSSTNYARADHVHPSDTSRQAVLMNPVTGPGSGATIGHLAVIGNTSGTSIADGGAVPASFPGFSGSNPAMDGVASPGASANAARSDHVHPTDTSKANIPGGTGSISLSSGVTSFGGSYAPLGYCIFGNLAILSGTLSVAGVAKQSVIATLPAAARPTYRKLVTVPTLSGDGSAIVLIDANGNITLWDYTPASITYIGLDGILFRIND